MSSEEMWGWKIRRQWNSKFSHPVEVISFFFSRSQDSFTTSCPRTSFHGPCGQHTCFNPGIFSTFIGQISFGGCGISIPQRRDGSSDVNTLVDWGGFLRSAIVFRSNANTDIEERIAECEPREFSYAMADTRARFSFNERETRLSQRFVHFRAFDFFEVFVRSGFVTYGYGERFLTASWQIRWHVGLATYRVKLLNFHRSTNLANTLRIWNFSAVCRSLHVAIFRYFRTSEALSVIFERRRLKTLGSLDFWNFVQREAWYFIDILWQEYSVISQTFISENSD